MTAPHLVEACARHAHEVNRAYCDAIGDPSQRRWDEAEEWQRESMRRGVRAILSGDAQEPEALHAAWLAAKVAEGWMLGPVKDAVAKTHPCMVPYSDLPAEQKVKDHLIRAAVIGMATVLIVEKRERDRLIAAAKFWKGEAVNLAYPQPVVGPEIEGT